MGRKLKACFGKNSSYITLIFHQNGTEYSNFNYKTNLQHIKGIFKKIRNCAKNNIKYNIYIHCYGEGYQLKTGASFIMLGLETKIPTKSIKFDKDHSTLKEELITDFISTMTECNFDDYTISEDILSFKMSDFVQGSTVNVPSIFEGIEKEIHLITDSIASTGVKSAQLNLTFELVYLNSLFVQ